MASAPATAPPLFGSTALKGSGACGRSNVFLPHPAEIGAAPPARAAAAVLTVLCVLTTLVGIGFRIEVPAECGGAGPATARLARCARAEVAIVSVVRLIFTSKNERGAEWV